MIDRVMQRSHLNKEEIIPAEDELPTILAVERLLAEQMRMVETQDVSQEDFLASFLYSFNGQMIPLPPSLHKGIVSLIHSFATGSPVSINPHVRKYISTKEAADMLNVSRPHFIKLLDNGSLPIAFHKVGRHRRIELVGLLEYKMRQEAERRKALTNLVNLNSELGIDPDDIEEFNRLRRAKKAIRPEQESGKWWRS